MMKLNVPLYLQTRNSVDCGLACLAMVFNYYGLKTTIAKIKKELYIYKNGIYTPQVGKYLISQGFSVTITTLNPHIFTLRDKALSQKQILEKFIRLEKKERNPVKKRVLKKFQIFMQAGGKIELKIPNIDDIKMELNKSRPVMLPLTTNFLEGKKPKFNLHYNVITGFDDQYIYVNDPLWDHRGGKKKYLTADYLFGFYAGVHSHIDNGCLLKIKFNERKK